MTVLLAKFAHWGVLLRSLPGWRVLAGDGHRTLRETDRAIGLIDRVVACFLDGRDRGRVVHALRTLIGQRIIGLALGYEDVADHDEPRFDPVLVLFSDRLEPRRPGCAPLGGKSTRNRLEHAPRETADRYRGIAVNRGAVENLLVELFLDAHPASGSSKSFSQNNFPRFLGPMHPPLRYPR